MIISNRKELEKNKSEAISERLPHNHFMYTSKGHINKITTNGLTKEILTNSCNVSPISLFSIDTRNIILIIEKKIAIYII